MSLRYLTSMLINSPVHGGDEKRRQAIFSKYALLPFRQKAVIKVRSERSTEELLLSKCLATAGYSSKSIFMSKYQIDQNF